MGKNKFLSMKKKLIMLILITLVPLTIISAYELKANFTSSINMELDASEDYCEATSKLFTNYIDKIWTTEFSMGMCIASHEDWFPNEIQQYMNNILTDDEDVLGYIWLNPKSEVAACTNNYERGSSLKDRDYVQEILNGKEKVISNLKQTSDSKEIILPVARGLRINGELKGIIICMIDVDKLYKVFPSKRVGELSRYGLIDKNGRIVYRNGIAELPFEDRTITPASYGWRALKGEVVRYGSKASDFDGSNRMGVEYPIEEFGWSCYATSSVSEVTGIQLNRMKKDLILCALLYFISFALVTILARQHMGSIKKLVDATDEVIGGNLVYKADIKGNKEYFEVAQALNKMTEGFNQKINEVEEYNNLKSQFLSTMSHELKTPLNIILGCVQLMEGQVLENKSFTKYLKMLKQNSFRLLRLINNFIDINKIEVNNMSVNKTNGDFVQVVEDITLSVVEYTKLKNIDIIFDTEVEEKYMAFDPDKIERILLNLLSNSIKFTEPGGTIEVSVYDKNESIILSVKDNGIGIPKEMQEKIFERFVQVDSTLRRRAEGSGIGLSLVQSLVQLHGGKISVTSEPGKGSEFTVKLPVVIIENEIAADSQKFFTNVERIDVEFSDIYT